MSENAMTLSAEKSMRRQQIELRIEMHRDNASGSLLEIGRQLNAAKDEGVVPHGQWTDWVAEHAAMSERVAQKWMQAARELPEGSPIARLGIAKIQSLMMISSGEREAFAERIGAEKLTSREVEQQVRAARAERDEALRLVGEQKKRLCEMDQRKDAAVMDAIARTRSDVGREKQAEIDRLNSLLSSANMGQRRTNKLLDEARASETALRQALAAEKQKGAQPDPEQARRIALLEAQIRSRDAAIAQRELEIDRLSDRLDEAQTAAMRGGMTGGDRPGPSAMILSAIGALMAEAGRAPGELARMQGVDAETRAILCGQARLVGQWAMQILAACGEGEGCV